LIHVQVLSKILDEMAERGEERIPLKVDPALWEILEADRDRYPYRPRRNPERCAYGHAWPAEPIYGPNGKRVCQECVDRPRHHVPL
jgi:hypothetical protein